MQIGANNLRPPVKDQHLLLATNSFVMGVRLSIKIDSAIKQTQPN